MRPAVTAALASCVAAAGCVPVPAGSGAALSPRAGEAPHRIYDTRTAEFIDFSAMVERLNGADVIFFGEQHGDAPTHRLQLRLLEAVRAERPAPVLSMEQFERDVQPLVDDYLTGRLPEPEFLASARPWNNYARDYRPMVELAKRANLPVVAANVPTRHASLVARQGLSGLETLAPAERLEAAADLLCPRDSDGYYRRFVAIITGHQPDAHGSPAMGGEAVDRLYEAQCLRDETMAESIVAAAARSRPILHTTGSFHSDFRQGTVERVARRAPALRLAVISAMPVPDLDQPPMLEGLGRGDFLIFTLRPADADPAAAESRRR